MAGRSQQLALLETLFEGHYGALLAYARRRTEGLHDAEEVVAETFVVAWRRLDDLPRVEAERLPWLYGVARRLVSNNRRGAIRRGRLFDRMREAAFGHGAAPSHLPAVFEAMAHLREGDQEILRLAAWEELSHADIGTALGISPNAATIRLHRARARLKRQMSMGEHDVKGLGRIRTLLGWKGSAPSPATREKGP